MYSAIAAGPTTVEGTDQAGGMTVGGRAVLWRRETCPAALRRSHRPPDIPMVQAADPRKSDHLPELPRLDLAGDRRVAVEAHVRAVLVVVAGMPADQVEEMTLTEHDHVIEQLSTKGAYPPFRVPTRETSSSPRHLTASRAVAPTTTPSATGASFAHSHERTCESIWPTACKGSNIRVLQQLSSVPPSPAPVSSPLRTGQGASTGLSQAMGTALSDEETRESLTTRDSNVAVRPVHKGLSIPQLLG